MTENFRANPDWENQTRPALDVIKQDRIDRDIAIQLSRSIARNSKCIEALKAAKRIIEADYRGSGCSIQEYTEAIKLINDVIIGNED